MKQLLKILLLAVPLASPAQTSFVFQKEVGTTTTEVKVAPQNSKAFGIDANGTLSMLSVAGASTLAGMTDVALTGLADGDLLRYHGVSSTWKNITGGTLADSLMVPQPAGAWLASGDYHAGDMVSNGGIYYLCILDHVATGDDEPGQGVNQATYWEVFLSAGGGTWGSITGTLSNQGDLNTALGNKQPIDATLTALAALADGAGALTNDGNGALSWTAMSTGDMLKATYDPQNAGYISGASGAGGVGGSLRLQGGTGGIGGNVHTYGGSGSNARGGHIQTYGGAGNSAIGGSIITIGVAFAGGHVHTYASEQAAGASIQTYGGTASGAAGGHIRTYGGGAANAAGGSILTYGGDFPGGAINTTNGGGDINTTAGGDLTMGAGNLTGTAATGNIVSTGDTGTVTATMLATDLDLGGKTSLEIPNGAAPTTDAFGEIAGDSDAWTRGAVQFYDGTENTYLVGALASDPPENGQVPTWNTGGTITWNTPSSGGVALGDSPTWTGAHTFTNAAGIKTLQSATQDAVTIKGRAGGTSSYITTVTPGTLTASNTITLPIVDSTLAVLGANTFTGAQTMSASGAVNTPSLSITGAPSTAGDSTTDFPLVYLNETGAAASSTLNTNGTLLGVNGNNTADLINAMQDGVSRFSVSSAGTTTLTNLVFWNGAQNASTNTSVTASGNQYNMVLTSSSGFNFASTAGGRFVFKASGGAHVFNAVPSVAFILNNNYPLGWTSDSTEAAYSLSITRDADNTLQMGVDHATAATAQTIKAHDVTTGTGASITLAGGRGSAAGGAVVVATSATNGVPTTKIEAKANGSVAVGAQAVLATSATDGFLYVPTCAGTPTGVPTAITGLAPIVIDTTNNKLYFYSGGAWRDAGP